MRSIADTAEERWIGTQMIDREKVITGLGCLADENSACHSDCPYFTDRQDGGFCFRKMAHDALEILKEQPEQEREHWISVKDDLPKEHDSIFANHTHLSKHMWAKESDNVIVYVRFPDGTGRSTEGRLQDGKWWTRVSPMLEPVVTHWMPFPEPPKEVTQGGRIE